MLLLALALCACGGGDAGDDAKASDDAARTEALAVQDSAGAPPRCPPNPPKATAALLRGPWQALANSMKAQGAAFPVNGKNSDTTVIQLCTDCDSVALVIQANTATCGATPATLQPQDTSFLGIFLLAGNFQAQNGWPSLQTGDTLALFVSGDSGSVIVTYRDKATGLAAQAPAGDWQFYYCQDGSRGTHAAAQWRSRATPSNQSHDDDDEDDDNGGGSYGWMACASGCCQFYTPPPNELEIELPDQANEKAPGTVGPGRNRGNVSPRIRPTWCVG
ncbi:MAG TPA: hypothetical protein VHG93_18985 [Longimicrobium sp.]|nr:hypothetical protein [Longimicrobium sp.]